MLNKTTQCLYYGPLNRLPVQSLLMLPPSEVAGKIILVLALVAADVALERVLVAVTAHVDGAEDVIGEVDVTVQAVEQNLGVVVRDRQSWGWGAGLAVGDTGSTGATAVLAAGSSPGTVATMGRGPRLRGDRGRRGCVGRAGRDSHGGCGRMGQLDEERLLVDYGLGSG